MVAAERLHPGCGSSCGQTFDGEVQVRVDDAVACGVVAFGGCIPYLAIYLSMYRPVCLRRAVLCCCRAPLSAATLRHPSIAATGLAVCLPSVECECVLGVRPPDRIVYQRPLSCGLPRNLG